MYIRTGLARCPAMVIRRSVSLAIACGNIKSRRCKSNSYKVGAMLKAVEIVKSSGLGLLLVAMSACSSAPSPYDGLPHKGKKLLRYTRMEMQPFRADASRTSLGGQWLMQDSILYFMDSYMANLKAYDWSGSLVSTVIRQGRGPGEMSSPAWISAIDKQTGNWIVQDKNAALLVYDSEFKQISNTMSAWFNGFLSGGDSEMERLFKHPDPENVLMYEYNHNTGRMHAYGGRLYMPVITEHAKFNGYNLGSHAKDYWRQSHVLLSFEMDSMPNTTLLFGNYPPVYQETNIPLFSSYDFAIEKGRVYIGYEADSLIYAYDAKGNLLYSIGFGGIGISGNYPATYSFEEYEQYARDGYDAGHYNRLYVANGYLFRTYVTDEGEWHLQVYEDEDLVGDIVLPGSLEVFGYYDGWYYAFQSVDIEDEMFEMLRFRF